MTRGDSYKIVFYLCIITQLFRVTEQRIKLPLQTPKIGAISF